MIEFDFLVRDLSQDLEGQALELRKRWVLREELVVIFSNQVTLQMVDGLNLLPKFVNHHFLQL
jgi:hypothetical protein